MCGIHGVINAGNSPNFLEKYMQEGFVVNSVRGMDSSGIFQIDKEGKPFMHKLTMPGPYFIDNKATKQIIEDAPKSALTVGHVRAATHGGVTVNNAHPFMVRGANNKRIFGVHNGTLASWKTKKDWSKFDVDSEWGLAHIGAHGIKAFEDIDGAFAFVWYDENTPGKMYAVRNHGRPLWFVLTKDHEQMMFGSESGMVSWLCERNNIPTEDSIYELETMKLYTFDYTGKKITFTKETIPAYKSAYTPASSPYHAPPMGPRRGFHDGDWSQRNKRRQDAQSAFENMDDGAGEASQFEWDDALGYSRNDEGRGTSRAADSFPAEAERLVDASKKVLSQARAALYKAEAIATGTVGNIVDTEIVGQRDDDAPVSRGDKAVTNKAKRRAKKAAKAQKRGVLHMPTASTKATSLSAGIKRAVDAANAEYAAVLEAGNDRALVDTARDFPEEILEDGWYSTGGATEAEKAGAKELGIYGQMQWFEGTAYEPDTAELIGDIEDYLPGNGGKTRYIGIMRNTTASVAQRDYIGNAMKGGWVAVIGVSYMREWNGKTLIVGELTDAGKAGMLKRQAA